MKCPKCKSDSIEKRNYGKRAGTGVGGGGGAAGGAASAVGGAAAGAKAGAAIGAFGGPIDVAAGASIGAIAGALAGGTVGATARSVAGRAVDKHILNNFKCLTCGHTFNEAQRLDQTCRSIMLGGHLVFVERVPLVVEDRAQRLQVSWVRVEPGRTPRFTAKS